jgi:hypothetical protein
MDDFNGNQKICIGADPQIFERGDYTNNLGCIFFFIILFRKAILMRTLRTPFEPSTVNERVFTTYACSEGI